MRRQPKYTNKYNDCSTAYKTLILSEKDYCRTGRNYNGDSAGMETLREAMRHGDQDLQDYASMLIDAYYEYCAMNPKVDL